jgi:hypothetical protein
MQVPKLTKRFNLKFGTEKTDSQIKSCLSNHGLTCGRPTGNPKGAYRLYTPREAQFLRDNYTGRTVVDLTILFNRRFHRDMTQRQIKTFVHNNGITCGNTGCFVKGHRPWNTGTKGLTGANKTSFRKGHIPENIKPLGAERLNVYGYLEIKISEQNPYTGASTRYQLKHVHIWEKAHGKVPQGFCLAFKDGNPLNCILDNLILLSRDELLELNQSHYKEAPPEIKPNLLMLSKLNRKIAKVSRRTT